MKDQKAHRFCSIMLYGKTFYFKLPDGYHGSEMKEARPVMSLSPHCPVRAVACMYVDACLQHLPHRFAVVLMLVSYKAALDLADVEINGSLDLVEVNAAL